MITHVFFDLYQTLIGYDPPREELEYRVLDELGIKAPPDRFRRAFAVADEYFYTENAKKPLSRREPQEVDAIYARHQSIVLREGGIQPDPDLVRSALLRLKDFKFKTVLFDDVIPALTELQRREISLGLVSNVDKDISPMLDELGLSSFLETVVTSRETGFTKPHPEIFAEALRQAGATAERSAFVGDQYQIDVLGASAVGMKGILVARGGLADAPADCPRIESLPQLINWLD
ncbi:Haloacid dehalogenase domain protein hydrolase [Dehalogenimonas lykanthroporepellens BL-DC-9]|nr:Haloacid dehalogenase domain protein hydrolase [Dehalogenimonas lykanthroporepellens BL-DC-9]